MLAIIKPLNLGSLTILSSILSLLLDILLFRKFGFSSYVDAFRIATIIHVFVFQIFLIVLIPKVFIAVATNYLYVRKLENLNLLFIIFLSIILIIIIPIIIKLFYNPEIVQGFIAPGLPNNTKSLLNELIPYFSISILFLTYCGICNAVANYKNIFWLAPTTQIIISFSSIIGLIFIGDQNQNTTHILGISVVIGTVISSVIHTYIVSNFIKFSILFKLKIRLRNLLNCIYVIFKLSAPIMLSLVLGFSISVIINRQLSYFDEGTISIWSLGWKLASILMIFPSACINVKFSIIARLHSLNLQQKIRKISTSILIYCYSALTPIILIIIFCADTIVSIFIFFFELDFSIKYQLSIFLSIFCCIVPVAILQNITNKISLLNKLYIFVVMPELIQITFLLSSYTFFRSDNPIYIAILFLSIHFFSNLVIFLLVNSKYNFIETIELIKKLSKIIFISLIICLPIIILNYKVDFIVLITSFKKQTIIFSIISLSILTVFLINLLKKKFND